MAQFRLEPLGQFAAVHLVEVEHGVAFAEQMPAGPLVTVSLLRFRFVGSPVDHGRSVLTLADLPAE